MREVRAEEKQAKFGVMLGMSVRKSLVQLS